MKYTVEMYLATQYEVEAESEDEAIDIADMYWQETLPETKVWKVED